MARFGLSQQIRQGMRQEMQLLPRMLQSIEVLQLPSVELEGYLHQAVEENVTLTAEPRREAPPADGHGRRGGWEESDRHEAWLQNQPDTAQGLVVFDVAEKTIYRLAPKKVHRYELESAFGGGSIDFSGTVVAVNSGIPEVEVKDYSVNRRPKPGAFKGCL